MAEKQLILVVEGTAAMGPFWHSIVTDYLEKIIRCFHGNELPGQKPPTSNIEFSVITYHAHGSYCGCLVQRSGWTRDLDTFLQWLVALPFVGGGFSEAAVAEGLAEALMMFSFTPNGNQNQQKADGQRQCILVAANNPYPLPTPVYRPPVQNLEQSENVEAQTGNLQSDAEAVAKSFAQCSISLSVISPKQYPKLRAIYNAAKRNPRAAEPTVDNVKNPQFLILLSENFVEARSALTHPGTNNLPSNQAPVKMDIASVTSVSGPLPASIPTVNGSIMNRQQAPVVVVPSATVKVEPNTVNSMVTGLAVPHIPSVPRATGQGVPSLQTSSPSSASQEMLTNNNDNLLDSKPILAGVSQPIVAGVSQPIVTGVSQPSRPVGPAPANVSILNNLSQARQAMNSAALSGGTSIGLPSMSQTLVAMHMSNMISSGMGSSVPAAQNVFSSGQSTMTSMAGPLTQVPQNSGLGSFNSTNNMSNSSNVGISQSMSNIPSGVSMSQSVSGLTQGNLSGVQMVQGGISVNQSMMNNLGQSGVSSGNGTMIPTPGMGQSVQSAMHSLVQGGNNNGGTNMSLPQQSSGGLPPVQSKYVKVWEGNLSGQRQGQPVFITRLEGYRSALASETLAANWPLTMQIVRLISQDHMNNKQYVGKADFLVFRAMNQHGFLGQLQEKKLCAVIQLPSQTLLLSVSDKACRLIGMLFPGDMVVFKPQQPQQMQQPQLQQQQQQQLPQLQQHQQLPQLQQHQQLPQLQQQQGLSQLQPQQQLQQQMVPNGLTQTYVQGPGRSQIVPQQQVSSQNMGGGAFMG